MYLDKELMFADAQALTGTAASTNVIDLGASRDVGIGKNLMFVTLVKAAITGTLVATLQGSDDEAFGSGVTTIAVQNFAASAAAGATQITKFPPLKGQFKYLRVNFTGATAGEVSSFINLDADAVVNYPANYEA